MAGTRRGRARDCSGNTGGFAAGEAEELEYWNAKSVPQPGFLSLRGAQRKKMRPKNKKSLSVYPVYPG
jgi:hypothetical protein